MSTNIYVPIPKDSIHAQEVNSITIFEKLVKFEFLFDHFRIVQLSHVCVC